MRSKVNDSIDKFAAEAGKYPLLSREREMELARRYQQTQDMQAAHMLVAANLRFVIKIAHEYRGYGLDLPDIIQEGNIGLMMAVKRFDPSKGYRLVSYAVWWIRAYIQSFIIRSWSLVKVGTTQVQRKLFFKLRSEQNKANRDAGPGENAAADEVARRLKVEENDVVQMQSRLAARDFSLDARLDDRARQTHLDLLAAANASQEEVVGRVELNRLVRERVFSAMDRFNEKERYIVQNRLMTEEPKTLQEIGRHFRVTRERARQIECNVLRKVGIALQANGLGPAAA